MSSHFFWYLGTEIQKSQEGLSRALLYKIIRADRSLIPELLPTIWMEACSSDIEISAPSAAELQEAFEKMGTLRCQHRKFCFLVDGLDEYFGKPADGVRFLRKLAMNSNVKILVSSKPIQPCVQAFSANPKLFLQDLTYRDIDTYVDQVIGTHEHVQNLRARFPNCFVDLRLNLTNKAEGVFLWVVLACRSVREGLDNFDRLRDLKRRIDELPPELEELFRHMLRGIEPRYQDYAGKILLTCHQFQLTSPSKKLSALGLALVADYDSDVSSLPAAADLAVHRTLTNQVDLKKYQDKQWQKCRVLQRRFRTFCCGLLELTKDSYNSYSDGVVSGNFKDAVVFLHRTVFDFLRSGGKVELERLLESAHDFDPSSVLASVSLHLTGWTLRFPDGNYLDRTGANHVEEVLRHISNIGTGNHAQAELILTRLQELLTSHIDPDIPDDVTNKLYIYGNVAPSVLDGWKTFKLWVPLLLAVNHGHLSLMPMFDRAAQGGLSALKSSTPLLAHALDPSLSYRFGPSSPSHTNCDYDRVENRTDMARCLLSLGCNPNQEFIGASGFKTTPFEILLDRLSMPAMDSQCSQKLEAMVLLFQEAGADLGHVPQKKGRPQGRSPPRLDGYQHLLDQITAARSAALKEAVR